MSEPSDSQQLRRDQGPTTQRGETRKQALLDAARIVFDRQGFADTNVAAIVTEANVSRGTFYTYFDTKEDIFTAVARAVVKDTLEKSSTTAITADPTTSLEKKVRNSIRRFIAAYRPHAKMLGLMEQVGTFSKELADLRLEARNGFIDRTQRGLERMLVAGLADPDIDVEYAAETLGVMLEYSCYLQFCLGKEFDEDRLVDALTRNWVMVINSPLGAHEVQDF